MTPYDSDDLTEVIEEENGQFVVLRSSDKAGYSPDYEEVGRFSTRASADAFLAETGRP
ncbi:MAG: hypothetical protein ACRECO_00670 [Xanthobacteraceae bacterium]